MEVVSENTPEAVAARRKQLEIEDAKDLVQWALRDLAANILRVTRGAGKSYELGQQAQYFVECLIAYRQVVGCYPASWDLDAMLGVEKDQEVVARMNDENRR